MKNTEKTMEKLVALCKNRGFIYAGSEIYGGLANSWDYGPLGAELKNNVKKAWWKKFVQENPYNVGLDSAILMNPQVWVASGHVTTFNDPLIDCKACKMRHRADKLIEDWLKDYTIDEAVEIILASGCPAAPINTIDRIVADPHIAGAREMFVTLPHPTAGDMKICGNQIKLSETPVQFQRPAPLLGQHEEEILHEMLGLNADEVKALKEEGVL